MITIKSFSVGCGDMFYIKHGSDNFSIIDCCLSDENKEQITKEIINESSQKGIVRFISTHPDEDHIVGLKFLDDKIGIRNFYCIENSVIKKIPTEDFVHYCKLRDDKDKAFYIEAGCNRRWMNNSCSERDSAGISILWPKVSNENYKDVLKKAEEGESPNNTSAIIKYTLKDGISALWLGDLETNFLEKIENEVDWPRVDLLFAAHHGRNSGKVPDSILKKIKPKVVILGEAPSRHLNYYGGYNTITQNTAGDITFKCEGNKIHFFVSNPGYSEKYLKNEGKSSLCNDSYIGSLVSGF